METSILPTPSPVRQAAWIFGLSLFLMLGSWAIKAMGWYPVEQLFAWSIATSFTLLYAILNSLLSLNARNTLQYWGRSVYAYLGLAFANGLLARYISGIPLNEAESYRWIYIVISIGFLVFISLVNLMKRIVNFAEREEWNEPRLRSRRRRR